MDQALGSLRSILQYLIISEQEPLHFHFALGRTNCAAGPCSGSLAPSPALVISAVRLDLVKRSNKEYSLVCDNDRV